MHHPLTIHESRNVLLYLALWAVLSVLCLWGTGCANQHRAAVLPVEKIVIVVGGNVSLFEPNPSHPLEINREK